jgi:hypothetical protein
MAADLVATPLALQNILSRLDDFPAVRATASAFGVMIPASYLTFYLGAEKTVNFVGLFARKTLVKSIGER